MGISLRELKITKGSRYYLVNEHGKLGDPQAKWAFEIGKSSN
jgi:hypothetical protein